MGYTVEVIPNHFVLHLPHADNDWRGSPQRGTREQALRNLYIGFHGVERMSMGVGSIMALNWLLLEQVTLKFVAHERAIAGVAMKRTRARAKVMLTRTVLAISTAHVLHTLSLSRFTKLTSGHESWATAPRKGAVAPTAHPSSLSCRAVRLGAKQDPNGTLISRHYRHENIASIVTIPASYCRVRAECLEKLDVQCCLFPASLSEALKVSTSPTARRINS